MALSIFDSGDSIVLVDESGKALQSTPKESLSPGRLAAIQQYPAVDPSRYNPNQLNANFTPMSPGFFSPDVPKDFSIARALGSGLRSAGQDISTSAEKYLAPVVAAPSQFVAEASRNFGEGLGTRQPASPTTQRPSNLNIGQAPNFQPSQMQAQPVSGGTQELEMNQAQQAVSPNEIYDTGVALEMSGLTKNYREGQKMGAQVMGALDEQAKIAEKQVKDAEAFKTQVQAEYDYMRGRINDRIAQLESQAPNKTFGEWFADKSTPGKILWGIALGAATAASLTKAGSAPLSFIDGVIRQDIASQVDKYQKAKTLLEAEKTGLGQMIQTHGNLQLAIGEAAEASFKFAAAKVDHAKAKVANAQQRGQLEMLQGQLLQKAALQRTQNEQMMASIAEARAKSNGMDPERMIQGLGYAPYGGKEELKELRNLFVTANSAQQGINRLLDLSKKTGSSVSLEDRKAAAVDVQKLIGAMRLPFFGPGILNDKEQAAMRKLISNPTKIFSLDAVTNSALNRISQVLNDELNIRASSHGVKGYSGGSVPPGAVRQLK